MKIDWLLTASLPTSFICPTASSSFTVCTFWLVYALHRIGMVDEAKSIFFGVLAKRNPLGLLSEDIRFEDGRLLGNFPQAYSHLALIACAKLLASAH
jgi:alpha,alpha-trehalase